MQKIQLNLLHKHKFIFNFNLVHYFLLLFGYFWLDDKFKLMKENLDAKLLYIEKQQDLTIENKITQQNNHITV